MSPYPIVSPPSEDEELLTQVPEIAPALTEGKKDEGERKSSAPPTPGQAGSKREWFSDAMLEMSSTRPRQRTFDYLFSLLIHTTAITILILMPLYFTEAIDLKQFAQTMLIAPPPPPPPPPPPAMAQVARVVRRVLMQEGRLQAPTVIPKQVAMLKEEQMAPDISSGAVGGVPGGVPGGYAGGVLGGILQDAQRAMVPLAPPAKPKAPIRVGGRVKAPRPISTPSPSYPILAKQAKVQGDVMLDAVISEKGDVIEMRVVSGNALLIPAAMDAVRNWKYEPTYLNEEPVAVQLIVVVQFRLDTMKQ